MEIKYTKTHEWVKFIDEKTAYIGITDHAQSEMGDIVYIRLPEVGGGLKMQDSFAEVESVKAVSDIYSPLSGTIAQVNTQLDADPQLINQSPLEAWIVKAENISETVDLLSEEDYNKLLEL